MNFKEPTYSDNTEDETLENEAPAQPERERERERERSARQLGAYGRRIYTD